MVLKIWIGVGGVNDKVISSPIKQIRTHDLLKKVCK